MRMHFNHLWSIKLMKLQRLARLFRNYLLGLINIFWVLNIGTTRGLLAPFEIKYSLFTYQVRVPLDVAGATHSCLNFGKG